MSSLIELFDWVVTITGVIVLLMFVIKATQREETPLIRLLGSVNAITIKVGAVSALLFLLILHYELTGGVLSIKSIGFYVAVGSILLTIGKGWGIKSEVIEGVGVLMSSKAKQVQDRFSKAAEEAKRATKQTDDGKQAAQAPEWFYVQGTERKGPFSAQQFKRLAASGELTPTTMIWKKGMEAWTPASQIEGLFG